MINRSPPTDAALPILDAPHTLFDVAAALLLNLFTAGALIGGGFFCLFCSF